MAVHPIVADVLRDFGLTAPKPRFPETFCSQCGAGFGPGDHGYSHCHHHTPATRPSMETRRDKANADASFEANAEDREERHIRKLTELLAELREFLADQMDTVDGPEGDVLPNDAMRFVTEIDELIGRTR